MEHILVDKFSLVICDLLTMSGNKCQYLNRGKLKRMFPNFKFYRFPNYERR